MELYRYETPLGQFEVETFSEIVVNGELEWKITYTAGKEGIQPGGAIKVVVPAYQHERSEAYLQTYNYWESNYLYAVGEEDRIQVDTVIEKVPSAFSHIKRWPDSSRVGIIKSINGLKEGEKIHIQFGGIHRPWLEGECAPSRVGQLAFKKEGTYLVYHVSVDSNGNGKYEEVDVFPNIKIVPDKAYKMIITAPSQVNPHETFDIQVDMVDRFNNPLFDYDKKNITLDIMDLKQHKKVCSIPYKDGGYKGVLENKGFYEVLVKQDHGLGFDKAVILCQQSEEKIYWGDLHSHSNLTANIRDNDGGASPEAGYTYAKDVSHLDYICISEQTFTFNEDRTVNIDKATWNHIGEKADKYDRAGELVTFPGFELHSKRGDTIVLFGRSLAHYPYPTKDVKDLPDVWSYYKDKEHLTIPHFHRYCGGRPNKDQQEQKYTGFDLKNWEASSDNERLAEVFSSQWGRFEYERNPMILKARANVKGNTLVDFLNKGKKWGITASSDGHDGKPGYGGITGVYAKHQNREDIYRGLRSRKTIASTHPRVAIDFRVNDYTIGEVVSKEAVQNRLIQLKVVAPQLIKHMEVIKNGEVIKIERVQKQWAELSFNDDDALVGDTYYYVRVTQVDGHLAWASPIWFMK